MNDFTNCPYWGIGGRYVADPVTGIRTPVIEGAEPPAVPDAAEPVAVTDTTATTVKPLKEKK